MDLERRLGLPAWYGYLAPATEPNIIFEADEPDDWDEQWAALALARGSDGELDWILAMSGNRRAVGVYAAGPGTTVVETPRIAFMRAWMRDPRAQAALDRLGEDTKVRLWCDNTVWRANWGAADELNDVWQRNGRFARLDPRTQTEG